MIHQTLTVKIDCGVSGNQKMVVTYRGEALVMYATGNPTGCVAEETEPAVFQIDAFQNTDCPIQVH